MKKPLSGRLVALFAAAATLAMATLIDASSSSQVEQFGQMAVHRSAHKATALSDGRVLITGGRNTAGIVIADTEIFNPNTGESSAVAPMGTARVDHTATLLKDGRVLITGGTNATGTLNSAEIFDPSTGTFSAVSGRLNMARARHTATLLSSGKVLIAGGDVTPTLVDPNGTDITGTAEIFDPTARTFGDLVLLQRSRSGHTATLFSNDTVWLVGGGNNTILVAGGENAQHQPMLQIATFNPARIWTDKDDYLPDDPVILSGSGWKANENIYLFAVDSETDQWTYESTIPADANGEFSVNPYFIVQLRQLGTLFHVTAMGAQSAMQADVTFTDANHKLNIVSLTITSPAGAIDGTMNVSQPFI